MKDRHWKNLIKDIQNQRCILMLGPGLSTINGEPLVEAFSKYLVSELESESIPYEKNAVTNLPYIAQRFMSIPDIRRIDLEDEAVSFLKKNTIEIPEVFKLLAKVPFHLIINTTPENFMLRALKETGRTQPQALHYNFKKDRDNAVPSFSSDQTLVYNLFGSEADPESMVFTEKEQVEFMKNVVRDNPSIPHKITSEFDDRKTYLFLGFNIEDWRFPLLLDSLQIESLNSSYAPDYEKFPVSKITKSFFEDCYRFRFIENNVIEFIEEMVERFEQEADGTIEANQPEQVRKIVLLYAEKDESYRDELIKHMSDLERNQFIEIWHKGKIEYGEEVSEKISEKLQEAEVVLFLISADFLSSDEIFDFEIPKALARKEEGVKLFPILIRTTDFENSELGKLLVFPQNKKAVNSDFWNTPDEAYQQIVTELKNTLFNNG